MRKTISLSLFLALASCSRHMVHVTYPEKFEGLTQLVLASQTTTVSFVEDVSKSLLAIFRSHAQVKVVSSVTYDFYLDFEKDGYDTQLDRKNQILHFEAPPIRVTVDANTGRVRLDWERSARTIGLESEVHRGDKKDFTPGAKTLLSQSLLAHFVDKKPPGGTQHYALVLLSGDVRSAPARAVVTVPPPRPPAAPVGLTATPGIGSVELRWQQVQSPKTRYHVYRSKPPGGQSKQLTTEPIVELRYSDATAPVGVKHAYTIRAVSERGGTSGPSQSAAAALPEVRDPLFTAAFTANAEAALYGGGKARGTLHGKAKIAPDEKALDLRNGGYATFAHRGEFDLTGKFSLACRVKLGSTGKGQIPIVASCGLWNKAGWFLQRIGSGWRWHVGGIDCDGGAPAPGKWTELVGTFDGRTARLYQDGRLVATKAGKANRTPWSKPLHVGQYSGGVAPSFQVNGLISNVRIYGCAVNAARKDTSQTPRP